MNKPILPRRVTTQQIFLLAYVLVFVPDRGVFAL